MFRSFAFLTLVAMASHVANAQKEQIAEKIESKEAVDFSFYKPVIGEKHFDFVLPRIGSREPWQLSKMRGKKILLIHFASW